MKNLYILGLFVCLCPFLMAQNLQVTRNTHEKVEITFTTDSVSVENLSIPEGNFSLLSMQGYDVSNNPGEPQLPLLAKLLQIPVCDSVVVTIVDAKFTEYPASELGIVHPLYPSQPSVSKSAVNPPFAYDQSVYSTDAFYALPLVQAEIAGIRRDIALANVYVSPIQYNPVTSRIRIYTRIDVEFTFVNTNMTATQRLNQYTSPMFSLDYDLVLNPMEHDAKDEYKGVPIKYLIIANSMFSTNADLTSFVEWKRRLGYKVELAFTNDANVGTTTTSIKNFIQNKYNNATTADPAPTFLLLIGDVEQLPAFTGQSNSGHVTDLHYATLAGNDNLPDCYYGRMSATTNDELSNQIVKILMYEQYTMPDPTYLGNAVLIAGTDGNGYSPTHADGQVNYIYNYYINPNSTTHNFTTVYKHNYNCSSDAATIRSEINAGVSIANYTAHGSSSGWADPAFTTSHVSSMTNAGKYGLLIGNCCVSGKFDESVCFGESLLRAANKGAMGYIGASNNSYWNEDVYWAVGVRSSINANMSYNVSNLGAYDKWFHTHNEAYSNWVSTIGGILQGGNMSVQSSSSSRKLYYWEIYHCFGDPSVRVYMGIPSTMTVTANSDIPVSSTSHTVQAVPYAYVALKKNTTEYVAAAFANASGTATLTFSTSLEIGSYELVVLAQNRIPYFQDINVVDDGACATPSNLAVSNVTPFTATISWTGSADSYNVQRKTNSSTWTTVATHITSTTCSLTGLQDNTDYQVRVQSVCSGETSYWKTVEFTTPVACPVPTGLACVAFTPTTATLNWTENGSASSWTLQYGTNNNFTTGTYTEVTVNGNPSITLSGLIAESTYYARVKADCGSIYGMSQWSAVSPFMPSAVQTVEIGDGDTVNNTFLPSYSYYKYGISQQIYTSEEIGSAGTIKSISFKNTGEEKSRTYSIYLQQTDKQTFTNTSDWVAINSHDLVFSGDVTFSAGEWTKLSFTTPYLFDGESNLVVTVVDSTSSYTPAPHMSCLVFSANGQSLYNYTDNSAYNIADPGIAKSVLNIKNQIRVDIVPADGPVCPKPNGLSASNVTANTASLSWTEKGTANEWVLQYGTNGNFAAGTYTEVTVSGNPTLSLAGLTSEVEYYARVKAICSAEEESAWSGICSFFPTIKTIIGNATATSNYLPTNNYYKYSLTQQIYTTAELGAAGNILSIDFYKNNTVECNRNLDIYMVSTTKSSFSGNTDWITVTAADKVFSGMVNFSNNSWTTITLNTPFSYDGSHNVAIIVDDNTGSYKSNTTFLTFPSSNQAIRIYSDNTDYDASSPDSYAGTIESTKNHIRILKVVPCPEPSDFSATACESYNWEGEIYTVSGNHTRTFTTPSGCDSVVTLHLTINNPTHTAVTESACGSFIWNGTEHTTSGDYTFSHQDDNGCTQVDTLHLTINNPVHTAVTESACGSFNWNGTEYTTTGEYTYSHQDANGCTQVDTLHLTINNPVHTAVTESACGSYIWNGTDYTTTGDYTYSHLDDNGCTQVDTLHLTINNPVHTAVTESACGNYIWNGTDYTTTGDYTYSHLDDNGCTQIDTLHLTINNPVHTAVTESACGSYIWNGTDYTTTGDYTYS
ncbi:MAG: fibronectin type III domain-containing protein, partial [Bacteroidales bacterium]|nr:fibronectin type III domain-containing protein [Bacteroidales bacterium]